MQSLTEPGAPWSGSRKLIFRFCFLYFAIFILFTPNFDLPLIDLLYDWFNRFLHRFVPWFAKVFFGYKKEIPIASTGSGDTTYYYMLWLFGVALTIAGTIIWTVLDRKRDEYKTLYYWIRVVVRYYLFFTMVSYGLYKVIKTQFPFPSLNRLAEPYGDSSPMGLAWTYMGYSTAYNYFTGCAELLGGVLLLTRRTTAIGALVCLGVMTNVFMINISFDVPVKLLSFNTILMSLFLLWKDMPRLGLLLFQNKVVPAADNTLPYTSKIWRRALLALKLVLIIYVVWSTSAGVLNVQKTYGDKAPKPPLYGIYYTQTFIRNNDTVPPLETDTTRWKRVIIGSKGYAAIRLMNDTSRGSYFVVDTAARTATVYPYWDTLQKTRFHYLADTAYLTLTGRMKGDSMYIRLKRFDEHQFRLVNRGFHWVNEFPFNK